MPQKNNDNKLNRDEIVAAVAQLIAEQGLENLTMRNIARYIGCSVGTLPHYFSGKEDIVIAALNWSSERIFNHLGNLPQSEIHLDSLYPLLSSSMPLSMLSDTEWRVRLCLWDYATTNEEMRHSVNAIADAATTMLVRLIRHLQAGGEIRKNLAPEITAAGIYHMCIGAGFNMLHAPMHEREAQLKPLYDFIENLRPLDAHGKPTIDKTA